MRRSLPLVSLHESILWRTNLPVISITLQRKKGMESYRQLNNRKKQTLYLRSMGRSHEHFYTTSMINYHLNMKHYHTNIIMYLS